MMTTPRWHGLGNTGAPLAGLLIAAALLSGPASGGEEEWIKLPAPMGVEQILARTDGAPAIMRYRPNPRIAVVVFPTLDLQARSFNRLAAFVELAGAPRDRVLDDAGLARLFESRGIGSRVLYLGHDYDMRDITRFFALATRDGIRLNAEEQALQRALRAQEDPSEAVISITGGRDAAIDPRLRRAVLMHELSHGAYFTDPAYRAYCRRFWRERLSARQRAGFLAFLRANDYDVSSDRLVVNEFQAYLAHSDDERLLSPGDVGLTDATLAALRRAFTAGIGANGMFPSRRDGP